MNSHYNQGCRHLEGLPTPIAKLDLTVDVESLRKKLEDHPEYFGMFAQRAIHGMEEMKDIWVRFNDIQPYIDKGSLGGFVDEHDSIWYPIVDELPEVKDIAFSLMSKVRGERLGGILITKVAPGIGVPNHRDWGWHAEYYRKYYIPVKNKPGARFNFDSSVDDAPDFSPPGHKPGERLKFKSTTVCPTPGEVFEFDNSLTHGVTNTSNEDRIALIICIRTEESILCPGQQ